MYIVMELCEKNQDLRAFIRHRYKTLQKRITEKEAILILDNLLQGLLWLNKCKILHRDIK